MTQRKSNSLQDHSHKRLSVQIALTGLSFLITNSERDEVLLFAEKKFNTSRTPEELLIEIDTMMREDLAAHTEFESVSVIYANAEYTVVPTPLFDENSASDYLKFNAKILMNDFIAFDEIKSRELDVVYVPYVNINNYLFDKFGSFQYFHAATILLESLHGAYKFLEEPAVYVHVGAQSFDLVIQRQGGLLLCNTYHYSTAEDFIYYILFSFEQLRINPDTANVILMGAVKENDALHAIAYTYIRNISFFENDQSKLEISEASAHEHVLLKNVC
jgi:hypothetical protein